jgi:hypothetical protein
MCLICTDLIKNRLTSWEAAWNLTEMVQDKELEPAEEAHVLEVIAKIQEKTKEEERALD